MNYRIKTNEAFFIIFNLISSKLFLGFPDFLKGKCEAGSLILILLYHLVALVASLTFAEVIKDKHINLCRDIKVKWISYVFGVFFSISFLILLSSNINMYAYYLSRQFFKNSPYVYIYAFLFIAAVSGAYSYPLGLSKTSGFFVPVIYISAALLIFFALFRGDINYLFPILGNGYEFIFGNILTSLSSLAEFAVLFFIIPLLCDKKDFKRISVKSIIYSFFITELSMISYLAISKDAPSGNITAPFFAIIRQIRVGSYLQHIDSLFMILYLISAFLYTSSMLFFCCYAAKEFFKTDNVKPLILPFSVICMVLCFWGLRFNFSNYNNIFNLFFWTLPFILPFVLYGIGKIKGKEKRKL